MCVIIVKPEGVKLPSTSILNAAHAANPHGCGFVTPDGIYKTLDFDAFKRRLASVSEDDPCIIHFRYATHGSVKTANCHPFKKGDVCFAHNGVLNIKPIGDTTDSETAFKTVIYPAIAKYGLFSKATEDVVLNLIGHSKFAIMQGSSIRLFGDFRKLRDNCYYSNFNFLSWLKFYN